MVLTAGSTLGVVNILDLQRMVNVVLGTAAPLGSEDLNGDGVTNILDLQALVNVILGIAVCP
jgi:hypothetical protein